ncbi:hypothetical protein Tco_1345631 [Tanacetum coccineum]
MFHYGNTNADAIKLKLFPSSLAGEANIWFNELSPDVITTWEEIRQAFLSWIWFRTRNHNPNLYHGLDEPTQAILDAKGIFLYKTPNEAHRTLTAIGENGSLNNKDRLTIQEIKGDVKEMRDGCNKCGGPHPSSDCDDKPMGGPKEEEENYASGGYRGNYYV